MRFTYVSPSRSLFLGSLLSAPLWAIVYFDVLGVAGHVPTGVFTGAFFLVYALAIPGLLTLARPGAAAIPDLLRPRWKHSSHHVRREAAKKADQRVLAKLAKDDDKTVREAAVERLEAQELLASVAKDDTDSSVRLAAIKRLEDHGLLVAVAIRASDPWTRLSATRKISDEVRDQQSLAQMASALVGCFQDRLYGKHAVPTALAVAERSGDKKAFEVVAQAILDTWGHYWTIDEDWEKNRLHARADQMLDIRDALLAAATRVGSNVPARGIANLKERKERDESRRRKDEQTKATKEARELEIDAEWVVRQHGVAFLTHLQAVRTQGEHNAGRWFRSRGIESSQQRLLMAYFEAKGFIYCDPGNIDNVSPAITWNILEAGSEYLRKTSSGT